MPEESYQQLICEEEGWIDLPQRAQELRTKARQAREMQQRIDRLRALLEHTDQTAWSVQLTSELCDNPGDPGLIHCCAEYARRWLAPGPAFSPQQAQKLLVLGLGRSCVPQLDELWDLLRTARVLEDISRLVKNDRLVAAADEMMQLQRMPGERPDGLDAALQIVLHALAGRLRRQVWNEVDAVWHRMESLIESPDEADRWFDDIFGQELETALRDRRGEATEWLWAYAAKRYSETHAFWKTPNALLQTYVDQVIATVRSCDPHDISGARAAAQRRFEAARQELLPANFTAGQPYRKTLEETYERIDGALASAEQLWNDYQHSADDQNWEAAAQALDQIAEIDLTWNDGGRWKEQLIAEAHAQQREQLRTQVWAEYEGHERNSDWEPAIAVLERLARFDSERSSNDHKIEQLLTNARTQQGEQLQEQIKHLRIQADETPDFGRAEQLYAEAEQLVEKLSGLADRNFGRLSRGYVQALLKQLRSDSNRASNDQMKIEAMQTEFDQALAESDPLLQLLLLYDLRKRSLGELQTARGRQKAQQLLAEIEKPLAVVLAQAYRGLVDFYTVWSAVDGAPVSFLLDRARLLIPKAITDQAVRDEIQQILGEAPREFRLAVVREWRERGAQR